MAFQFPNVFDLKVFFNASGNIWTNVYEVQDLSLTGTPPAPANDIVNRLITFVENNVSGLATVQEIRCYNHRYAPGPLPLAAEGPIWILPVNQPGQRETAYNYPATANNLLDGRAAAYVKKINSGRVGKLFLHNVMMEGDVDTTAAGTNWVFTGGAATFNPTAFAAQVTAYLASHIAGGTATDYKYCVPHVKTIHPVPPSTTPTYETSVSLVSQFTLFAATWHRGAGK